MPKMRILTVAAAWAAALSLCLLLPACNKSKEDTLAKIKREGVIRWGADPSGGAPFVFFDPDDPAAKRVIGFEMDIMDALAKHMGVRHEMTALDWDSLIPTLRARRADMVMNGLEINEARKEQVAFSTPYYIYEQQLTIRAEDKDKYKSLEDLKGHKIATLNAAEANNVLLAAGWTEDLLHPLPDSEKPYRELELKRVDGVLQESIIAAYYATPQRAPELYNLPKTFSPGRYAAAVRKEDQALLAEIDRCLELMRNSGELAEIYQRWGLWNDVQKDVGVVQSKPAK